MNFNRSDHFSLVTFLMWLSMSAIYDWTYVKSFCELIIKRLYLLITPICEPPPCFYPEHELSQPWFQPCWVYTLPVFNHSTNPVGSKCQFCPFLCISPVTIPVQANAISLNDCTLQIVVLSHVHNLLHLVTKTNLKSYIRSCYPTAENPTVTSLALIIKCETSHALTMCSRIYSLPLLISPAIPSCRTGTHISPIDFPLLLE